MSEFDPDNRAGSGGGAGFQEIKQGGNVTSRLPGRRTFSDADGVGTTTVQQIKNQAASAAPEEKEGTFADPADPNFDHGRKKVEGTGARRQAIIDNAIGGGAG